MTHNMSMMLVVAVGLCAMMAAISGQAPVISPLVIQGREGDTVDFVCDSGSPGGGVSILISVFDEAQDTFIDTLPMHLTRESNGQFANFTFGPLDASDNNTRFICSTTRGGTSEVAVISVIFAPIITRLSMFGDPISVREGVTIDVELNVSANPQPSFYQWTSIRNEVQEVVVNDNGISVSLDRIVFNPTSREHSGVYRLVANNSAGSSEYNFTLDVQYPPEFPANLSRNTINCSSSDQVIMCASYPGVTAILVCDAVGNPLPTVSRSAVGVSDESNIDLVDRNIVITSVTADNAGTHTCTATSEVLSQPFMEPRTYRLYVGGVAQPLSDVEVNIDRSSVMVSWSYDNSRAANPVPAQYFIATVSQDGIQIGNPFVINIDTTSITVPGSLLQPESTYTVSVVVRNLQGDSEAVSESIPIPANFNNNAIAISMSYTLSFLALMMITLL